MQEINIRKINEELQAILEEENLDFVETGNGYLQVFKEDKLLFEIEYNSDDDYLCISDCTKDDTVYYIDTNKETNIDPYKLVREIKTKNSYKDIIEFIKKNKGYTVDYDKFGKEVKSILEENNNNTPANPNVKALVFEINKILTSGCRATLLKRVPADLKEDGVIQVIKVEGPKGKYLWGIYPDKEYLLCDTTGIIDVKDEYDIKKNPEGYSPSKFINDLFDKYGYKWAK